MNSGVYALIGVVIGGALNGVVAWVLDRLRLREDARVGGLLVVEELLRATVPLLQLREIQRWGVVRRLPQFGMNDHWKAHRLALGRALPPSGWQTLSAAYYGLEQAAERARGSSPDEAINEREGRSLAETYLTMTIGMGYLMPLIYSPPWWKPLARRSFKKDHAADMEKRRHDHPATQRAREWQERQARRMADAEDSLSP